ncbi:hypothetical protein VIBNISO65_460035 [Vibrio nigripulchritudo SO65]|nr:hypothetical protein VIBNIAM115_290012 [Vibrio nigripulchritudo AM115]CCN39386.1 hypothetical protein VIBNIFTn2_1040034 [Vibrio nigripulchritudo FTn2]CCN63517.1 hypothetical protein VIBNIPon4_130112 [Vibrio nigripulchritudo POn4]CCN78067.1 hypothetical protein VIBNISO65_460035 [Vibrio nigripulchritudo SO65]
MLKRSITTLKNLIVEWLLIEIFCLVLKQFPYAISEHLLTVIGITKKPKHKLRLSLII